MRLIAKFILINYHITGNRNQMSARDVCTYCLHPKMQHIYYLGQMDDKHPCKTCDCLHFKSM